MKLIISILLIFIVLITSAQEKMSKWDFNYNSDNFNSDALLDLRILNEQEAGENGFITLSSDSSSFITANNGEPIRFWAINGASASYSDSELKNYSRFLAKMGVNMIRFHGSVHPRDTYNALEKPNTTLLYSIWRAVSIFKQDGIYLTISPFYANMVEHVYESWGIDGYTGNEHKLWAVIFFHDGFKEAYKKWITTLYTTPNPYTGIPLKDDPAVGLIQVHNEDGVFWYTLSGVQPELKTIIKEKYYNWLVQKYGDITTVQNAWGDIILPEDDPENQKMDLYAVWDATQEQTGGKQARMTDQVQFLAEHQHNFYKEIYDHYRDIGCKQLINGSNWKTASPTRLLDCERWSNSSCDVIATNRYYSPGHIGEDSGWRIDPGHYYEGKSVLKQPHKFPVNIKQPKGHPVMITESGWNLPHKYQAEGPFLVSAYMSLTGVDGFYWYNTSSSSYDPNPYYTWLSFDGGQHPLNRWTVSTPGQIGMFPANALAYRLGYVSKGKNVILEGRSFKSMWERKIPVISEETGFDPNRDFWDPGSNETELSPLAYLTGNVAVRYGTKNDTLYKDPRLNDLIDYSAKTVKSETEELEWDYENGICTVNTPSYQGVCGFLVKKEKFELADVTIQSTNNYATVSVVAMDSLPLRSSTKILVQVGTVYQPTGWSETNTSFNLNGENVEGFRIDNTGKMPWKAEGSIVKLEFENTISRAYLLNSSGYNAEELELSNSGGKTSINLPVNTMYLVLERDKTTDVFTSDKPESGFFPNPTSGMITISNQLNTGDESEVELMNVFGGLVFKQKVVHGTSRLNVSMVANGIYFIKLKSNGKVQNLGKIIITKN